MTTFTKTRRAVAQAGFQTLKYNPASSVTAVTVNGSPATYTATNGLITVSSPTFAGGEALVVTEAQTPPSIPTPEGNPIVATTSVSLTRTQNGASTVQALAGVADVMNNTPALAVTGTTRSNH